MTAPPSPLETILFPKKEKVEINSNTDKSLKTLLEAAKKDKIDADLQLEIKQLEAAIEKTKDKELDKNKEEIKPKTD